MKNHRTTKLLLKKVQQKVYLYFKNAFGSQNQKYVLNLKPGARHYMAYVGPPAQYDLMGSTQFRLLTTLGLRASHRLLDFGCGSLRAGRLFIPYLDKGCYYGLEPNRWLIKDAIKHVIGNDMVKIKKPTFVYSDDFSIPIDIKFSYILAQSIFSHCGPDLVEKALMTFKENLTEDGLIIVTFVLAESDWNKKGWYYPECVGYTRERIADFIARLGMYGREIPWHHPRQEWYVIAKKSERLPDKDTFLMESIFGENNV
jgi:SAM-dependent methyltransferase